MALTLNEKSMFEELNTLLADEEKYVSVSWATISSRIMKFKDYIQSGDFKKIGNSNIYCYIGITKTNLNIVTLNQLDVTRITGKFHIPLKDIQNISIKKNLLRINVTFYFANENFTIKWFNGSGGTGIKNQRKYIQRFISFLEKHYSI